MTDYEMGKEGGKKGLRNEETEEFDTYP